MDITPEEISTLRTDVQFKALAEGRKVSDEHLVQGMRLLPVDQIDLELRMTMLYFACIHSDSDLIIKFASLSIDREHYLDCFSIFAERAEADGLRGLITILNNRFPDELVGMLGELTLLRPDLAIPLMVEIRKCGFERLRTSKIIGEITVKLIKASRRRNE
jgi:hypothetical protein